MADLYRLNGGAPAPLPAAVVDSTSGFEFRQPFSPADLSRLGYVLAPAKPADTATQVAGWDVTGQKWVMIDRPPTSTAPSPSPVFGDITRRQFFQALALPPYSLITQAEALDAVKTGEIPDIMQAVIDALPMAQRFPVSMILSGAMVFHRTDPMVGIFAQSQGMDGPATDAFWRVAEAQ